MARSGQNKYSDYIPGHQGSPQSRHLQERFDPKNLTRHEKALLILKKGKEPIFKT